MGVLHNVIKSTHIIHTHTFMAGSPEENCQSNLGFDEKVKRRELTGGRWKGDPQLIRENGGAVQGRWWKTRGLGLACWCVQLWKH